MTRKALHICVEVEVQAVTCPGVWLCPNGNVQLLFSMLGQEAQTKRLPPIFPLLFHEKFSFHKTYSSAGCLAEVQAALGREDVFAVLVQEAEDTVQLARFHCSALHLLYPSPCAKGLLAGVDVDLLMEASADYPGILSPKIELSTKTTVEEINLKSETPQPSSHVINPKTLCSQKAGITTYHSPARQVKEIFSDGKCYRQTHSRNARQLQDDLAPRILHPSPHPRSASCSRRTFSSQTPWFKFPASHFKRSHHLCNTSHHLDKGIILDGSGLGELCQCRAGHLSSKCPLCARYKATFSSMTDIPGSEATNDSTSLGLDKIKQRQKLDVTHQRPDIKMRSSRALHAHIDRVLEPDFRNIFCDGMRCKENPCPKIASHTDNSYPPPRSHIVSNQNIPGSVSSHSQKSELYSDSHSDVSDTQPACYSDPQSQIGRGKGDEVGSYRQLFYTNLEKFYRKLYMRAKYRAEHEKGTA